MHSLLFLSKNLRHGHPEQRLHFPGSLAARYGHVTKFCREDLSPAIWEEVGAVKGDATREGLVLGFATHQSGDLEQAGFSEPQCSHL